MDSWLFWIPVALNAVQVLVDVLRYRAERARDKRQSREAEDRHPAR